MTDRPLAPDMQNLTPNALLIGYALSVSVETNSRSPKTEEVGWTVSQNPGWVRRHGRGLADTGLATFSVNGHCWVEPSFGPVLEALSTVMVADADVAARCKNCGSPSQQKAHGNIVLFECGRAEIFCPDHVPGYPKAVLPARSRAAQHEGTWFRAATCNRGGHEGGSLSCDGTALSPGDMVTLARGSSTHGRYANLAGTVIGVCAQNAVVEFKREGRTAKRVVLRGRNLIHTGHADETGLTDPQRKVLEGVKAGMLRVKEKDGTLAVYEGARKVNQKTVDILTGYNLLAYGI